MKRIKNWISSPWIITSTIVNVFAVLTLLIYPPVETFIANKNEFMFQLSDISTELLKYAGITFVILEIVVLILAEWSRKIFSALVFAGTLLAYLQMNFLNPDYGPLGAVEMDWSVFENHSDINILIWTITVLVVLGVVVVIKKKVIEQGISAVSGMLIVMQVTSLIVLLITNLSVQFDSRIITKEGLYSCGDEEGSILVIMLDSMDNLHFDSTTTEYPELLDIFDGFTRFTDCSGSYSRTQGALPYIISGIYNLNEIPVAEHADQSYAESKLLNQLRDNGYDIRCFTDLFSDRLAKYVDNSSSEQYTILDSAPFAKTLLKLAAFRYLPEKIKPDFYTTSGDFSTLLSSCTTSKQFVLDDAQFYADLMESRITVAEGEKTFRLIDLFASHFPYTLDENVQKSESATAMSQNVATFKILQEYFQQMKEVGVYDNTVIVVAADHSRMVHGDVTFLVKPAHSTGELQYSDKPISHTDLHNTLFDLVGMELVDYGESVFAPYDPEVSRERTFYMFDQYLLYEAAPYMQPLWEIVYTEDWRTPNYTGNVYQYGEKLTLSDISPTVEFGTTYGYDVLNDFFCHGSLSWGESDPGYIFANLYKATMFFRLDEVPADGVDMTIRFITWIAGPQASLRIESNGSVLHDEIYHGTMAESITFHIPAECFDEDNLAVLDWITPDAVATTDHRYLSLGVRDFTVTK